MIIKKGFEGMNYKDFTTEQIIENMNVGIISEMLILNQIDEILKEGTAIINISGTFASAKGWLPYFTSKKSLEAFTIGLSHEYKDRGVKVNCLSPADTLTESYKKYFPQYATEEECIKPSDIADQVEYLIDEKGKYIKGQIIEIKK